MNFTRDFLKKNKNLLVILTVFFATISMNIFMFAIVGEIFSPNIETLFNYLLGNEVYYFIILFFKFFGLMFFVSFLSDHISSKRKGLYNTFISYLISGLFFLLFLSDILIPFSNYQLSLFFSNLAGSDEMYRILIANYKVIMFLKEEVIEEFLVTFSLSAICVYVALHLPSRKKVLKTTSLILAFYLALTPFVTMLVPEGEIIETIIFYFGFCIYQFMFSFILYLCTLDKSGESLEE